MLSFIRKTVKIISYCANAANAISKGMEVVATEWPTDNPFNHSRGNKVAEKEQIQSDQHDDNSSKQVEKLTPLH